MDLEIVSNINMDSLKYYLKDFNILQNCSYGNYLIDLIDENSSLYKSKSQYIIYFIDIDELNEDIDTILLNIEKFINKTDKIVILNTLSFNPLYIDTFLHFSLEREITINQKILKFAKANKNILLFDFLKLTKKENLFDDRLWYTARIKFHKRGFEIIANEIKNLILTYKYGSKKVLILDMDNTLWGGIIGEEEIELSNDGKGKVYLDFQKNIKKLKDFGVLLAICSKNNYDDGIKGLNHSNSILHPDDFIIKKINWQNKATNIKEIANELNLGLNSFVFIDDNPVERELVKTILPEVISPDFPQDIYELNNWFLKQVELYFSKVILTKEDTKKQEQYIAKLKREKIASNMDYEDFLKTLDIKIKFYIDDKSFIERYAQMTQKTNQFNLTTKRYTIKDIESFIEDKNYKIVAIEYSDKFANEGITGLVILKEDKNSVEIDTFLLSCRILKRGVEKAIFDKIEELYTNKNIIGIYIPTKKNQQVETLYTDFGFEKIDKNKFIKKV